MNERDAEMKCADYFSNFYMGRNSGGILGHKSKEKFQNTFSTLRYLETIMKFFQLPTAHMGNGLTVNENLRALFGALLFRILTKMVLLITLRRT
jgi:hypothetical protein